ncbi:MAG: RpiB/LacA/LacB family sugar-phosphate isomerase [Lentisphaerae bacterium]|nr:RpiB/LacA/LacB family sugar-phosphate isomerase [Lentisphaerota bacterium]
MKVVMGSVAKGYGLKMPIRAHLEAQGHEVIDVGCYDTDTFYKFPSAAERVAKVLQDGEADLGINCCGSGTGAAICTDKFKGVCALSCESVQTAKLARIVNDANCLCMGESIVAPELGCEMADAFLSATFQDMEGIPQKVLDFWKEARDEAFANGEIASARDIETLA